MSRACNIKSLREIIYQIQLRQQQGVEAAADAYYARQVNSFVTLVIGHYGLKHDSDAEQIQHAAVLDTLLPFVREWIADTADSVTEPYEMALVQQRRALVNKDEMRVSRRGLEAQLLSSLGMTVNEFLRNQYIRELVEEDQQLIRQLYQQYQVMNEQQMDLGARLRLLDDEADTTELQQGYDDALAMTKELGEVLVECIAKLRFADPNLTAKQNRQQAYQEFLGKHAQVVGKARTVAGKCYQPTGAQVQRRQRLDRFGRRFRKKAKRIAQGFGQTIFNFMQTATGIGFIVGVVRFATGKTFGVNNVHVFGGLSKTGERVKAVCDMDRLVVQRCGA